MAEYKQGDRVQVVDRNANAEDAKSGLFYNHYRGLVGSIQKVYANGEIAVEVELASLTDEIARRHHEVQEQMKAKWLDGLSEEARSRLTEPEKDFRLHYSILVEQKDLTSPTSKAIEPESAPRRRTSAEIEAEEEAYLQQRKGQS